MVMLRRTPALAGGGSRKRVASYPSATAPRFQHWTPPVESGLTIASSETSHVKDIIRSSVHWVADMGKCRASKKILGIEMARFRQIRRAPGAASTSWTGRSGTTQTIALEAIILSPRETWGTNLESAVRYGGRQEAAVKFTTPLSSLPC